MFCFYFALKFLMSQVIFSLPLTKENICDAMLSKQSNWCGLTWQSMYSENVTGRPISITSLSLEMENAS
jgi:hypothetical protein